MTKLNLGCGYPLTLDQLKRWKHLDSVEIRNVGRLEIEHIIGCDTPEAHWSSDQRVGNRHQPFAVKTVLSWLLFDPLNKMTHIRVYTPFCHPPNSRIWWKSIYYIAFGWKIHFKQMSIKITKSITHAHKCISNFCAREVVQNHWNSLGRKLPLINQKYYANGILISIW